MIVKPAGGPITDLEVDVVVVGHYENASLSGPAFAIDQAAQGVLSRLCEAHEITGKHGELVFLPEPAGLRARFALVVGLGKKSELERGAAFRAAGTAAKYLAKKQRSRVAFCLDDGWRGEWIEAGVCGALVGSQGQDLYRAERKLYPFQELWWSAAEPAQLEHGQILGESMNLTRRLVNQPPNLLYPSAMADVAEETCRSCGIEIEIWDQKRLEDERCGSLLAVAQGSARSPRLVIMRYMRGAAGQAPLVFVGKGVTFDSGGYSIKPNDGMKTMKCDMAGAATVLGAMRAIALSKIPANVIGLMGLVENLISGAALKVGDVLTARSGKTIEVLNTDAEGRLVLADVLDVALQHNPGAIVDLATLTGACLVALGTQVAGLMTNHQVWCDRVAFAARSCGEPVWQLPMFAEYSEQIRSSIADIKNVGDGRYGGAITAAKFLEEFVRDRPWTHLDIAGPAFFENPKSWIDAGGTGVFLRTLVELAAHWDGDASGTASLTDLPLET